MLSRDLPSLLLRIIVEAPPGGRVPPANAETADAQAAGTALSPIRSCLPAGIPEALIQRELMVWTGLLGVIWFELNGQRPQVVGRNPGDRDAFFAECAPLWIFQRYRLIGYRTSAWCPAKCLGYLVLRSSKELEKSPFPERSVVRASGWEVMTACARPREFTLREVRNPGRADGRMKQADR
jgi:hypothetical protein